MHTNRMRCILQNVVKAHTIPNLSSSEEKFICKFRKDDTGQYYFERDVPFGVVYVPIATINTSEFNKLHRVAHKTAR